MRCWLPCMKLRADAPIQVEMMGLIWISEKWEEGHFEKNYHREGLRKSFSLLLLCRVAEYPIKGLISYSREKHKLWTLFTCQNISAFEMSWTPKTSLPGWKMRCEAFRWSMLWSSSSRSWRPDGRGTVGGWTQLLWQHFIPWEIDDTSFLDFCFSFFLVSR